MNISLQDCHEVHPSDDDLKMKYTFVVREKDDDYYFRADDLTVRNDWVRSIQLEMIINCIIEESDEFENEKEETPVN
jgi:hypothetical protein